MKKFIVILQLLFAFAAAKIETTPELQNKVDSLGERLVNLVTEKRFDDLAEKTEKRFDDLVEKTEKRFDDLVEKTNSLQKTTTEQKQHIEQLELELRGMNAGNISTRYTRMGSVCPGNEITLSCPDGQTLLLHKAEYGEYSRCGTGCCTPYPLDCTESMESNNADEWALLQLRCDEQTSCNYLFQGSTFKDTCSVPNQVDYLSIYYSCQPDVPSLVGFSAHATDDRFFYLDDILLFDGLITNLGNFYDSTTSIFICPVSGVYMFSVNILTDHNNLVELRLRLDEQILASTYATRIADSYQVGSVFVIVECGAASKVWVSCANDDTRLDGNENRYSTFSGYLLHELT